MTLVSQSNASWDYIIEPFGGEDGLSKSAKATGACQRWREIKNGAVFLRLIFAYCLGDFSLRGTCAWACSADLVDIANPSLLDRLGNCEDWLKILVAQALAVTAAKTLPRNGFGNRLIRLVDGTSVSKAGPDARKTSKLWRIHTVYDLPNERFSYFALTDEKTGERLDMAPVIPGEIRIGDRCYLQPDRMAAVIAAGGDLVIRAVWTNARWIDKHRHLVNMAEILRKHSRSRKIDIPIWIECKSGPILGVRLVAVKKPEEQVLAAQQELIVEALKEHREVSKDALEAAAWVLIVTTLSKEEFSTNDILALYSLRWRIELAFKRLKSIVGLKSPPGKTERSAKVWILAHLLIVLRIEPLASELDDSPRWEIAA